MELNSRFLQFLIGILWALLPLGANASVSSLGSYNVKPDEITVSGISSGAFMAVQIAVSNSSVIKGVGAIAGGPYACAQGSAATATSTCMIGSPDPAPLINIANTAAGNGEIDPVSNLATLYERKQYLLQN